MANIYPPDLQQFMDQELASGEYQDESEVLIRALRVYREFKTRHESLRQDVIRSIEQAERGEVAPMDTEATKAEARRRLAASE